MAIDYIIAKTRSRSFSLNPGVGATVQEQEQDFQVIQSMLKPGAGVGVIKTWSIATCIRILIRVCNRNSSN